MKQIKTLVRRFNLACNLVVVLSMLLFLMLPGFLLVLLGFNLIMLFFWLGERMGIFEPGSYNDKHDSMLEVLVPFRDVVRMAPFAKRATKKDAP